MHLIHTPHRWGSAWLVIAAAITPQAAASSWRILPAHHFFPRVQMFEAPAGDPRLERARTRGHGYAGKDAGGGQASASVRARTRSKDQEG